tara:strand:+ start:26388 stop:27911 length:1524 start_codon:yes stop_codon:yes gene_type:complete
MKKDVRVRFAPSPTGPLHIGGVRTALYNYLYAKKHGGAFILRIEDTDRSRYVSNAEQYIKDSLDWCGIPFDEGPDKNEKYGPYRQSNRKKIYKKYVNKLIDNEYAYYAFDTQEQLDSHRKQHEAESKTFIYNWHNREKGRLINSLVLTDYEVKKRISNNEKFVIRFKTPKKEALIFQDEIRGEIKIDTSNLDDKILFKSDGMPTYHLANVVDDYLMKISHVIRGEEWLPSLPLHVLMYRAFGWDLPKFAHLPLILKPIGKGKLSKRDGDKLGFPVFPLAYKNEKTGEVSRGYREDGYFSDAFINMLSLLGWNPGNEKEIFSLKELIAKFDFSRVNKSGAKFNPDKTNWFNQQYLHKKTTLELTYLFLPILEKKNIVVSTEYVSEVISLIRERAVFINDFWELGSFFFETPLNYEERAIRKVWDSEALDVMRSLLVVISKIKNFTSKNIEITIKDWVLKKEIGFGKVMKPLRLAIVGAMKGPHLFDIMGLIGLIETRNRINKIIKELS